MRITSTTLNWIANSLLVVVTSTLGFSVWHKYFHSAAAVALSTRTAAVTKIPFEVGSHAPTLPSVNYASHQQSLLVFLSTTCRYCEAGVPFYNNLHEAALSSSQKQDVVGVFLQPAQEVSAFTARVNLRAKVLPNVDFRRFGVKSTPTALLVDRQGNVQKVWMGESPAIEAAIFETLVSPRVN